MHWKVFEDEAANFFRAKGYQVEQCIERVGKSEVIHEIDILASKSDETIACECKSGNQKPNKHLIADWESTCRDFPFNAKPAIASESGFTYYGLLYAKAYNVILIEKVKHYPYQQLPNLEIIDLTEIKSQT